MACFSNVSCFILFLLPFNCEVSSENNHDAQFSKMEEELLNVMDSILNLRRDLNKERTDRRENSEVLNRKISQCTCENQDRNQLQNYIDKVTVRPDVSECVDTKKIKNLERGLAKEKVLRIMTEEKVNSLEKELEKFRNLVESKLNEQNDGLNAQKAKVKAVENDIGQVNANVGSLKTDITNMSSDIGIIRSDIGSARGDTEESLKNVNAWIKTVEGTVENIRTNDLKAHKAMVIAFRTDLRSSDEDTGERLANLTARVNTVEKDVENIRTKGIARCNNVAFLGRLKSTLTSFKIGQKIVFDDIYENLGNWYQASTGVFTSPVAGVYIVLLSVSSEKYSTPDVEVVRNGVTLCRTVMPIADSWSVVPCNVVVHLDRGDQIWVQVYALTRALNKIRGDLFSTFSIGLLCPG